MQLGDASTNLNTLRDGTIAAIHNVSIFTVQTQLKSVRAKRGTFRQSELVLPLSGATFTWAAYLHSSRSLYRVRMGKACPRATRRIEGKVSLWREAAAREHPPSLALSDDKRTDR
jgi:hypothetical protein